MQRKNMMLYLILFSTFMSGEIVRHSHLDALYQYVEKYAYKQKIYVFFDIDDTILNTAEGCKTTVEKNTKKIIDDLKARGLLVYGLTSRSIFHSRCTDMQLKEVDVTFDECSGLLIPHLAGDVGYSHGIFYCGRTPKGSIIKQLFTEYAHDLSIAIIFIDDMRHDSVDEAAQELSIDCTFIHYTYAAEFIHNNKLEKRISVLSR
jgi:hypothetical protein